MSRVPPTYSGPVSRPAYEPHDHEGHDHHIPNRKERRARKRHNPLFTSPNVWRDWSRLNEHGLMLRFERIAKRRGKSKRWAENRLAKFLAEQREAVRKYNIWVQEQMALAKEEASGTDIRLTTESGNSESGGEDGDSIRSA